MRILQGYISKSVSDFPFHEIYSLDDYRDSSEPCVFFGNYRFEDLRIIQNHQGLKMIFWTGQDALHFNAWDKIKDCINVTAHPKVHNLIKNYADCMLVKPSSFLSSINPSRLGPNIYAYCPSRMPHYHGIDILQKLEDMGFKIKIGDGSIPQNLWKYSQGAFYDDIYLGLCLSEFAGGGTSIIEMGLRGIPVVTNVFNLPNCIRWNNIEDIISVIKKRKRTIGSIQKEDAEKVWDNLDHTFEWLEVPTL